MKLLSKMGGIRYATIKKKTLLKHSRHVGGVVEEGLLRKNAGCRDFALGINLRFFLFVFKFLFF